MTDATDATAGAATPLDLAWIAAEADGTPDSVRARFFALLMETPLMAPVAPPAAGDAPGDAPLALRVFDLAEGPVALAFDDDARMTAFFEGPTDYVVLPGAALVAALAEGGLGLGLNLGDAPSAALFPAADIAFLAREATGGGLSAEALAGPLRAAPPAGASPALLAALAGRVAGLPGLVAEAWLLRLGPADAPGALTLLLLPAQAARRAAEGLAALLGRAAQPYAPEGDSVAVGVLDASHPLLAVARAQGVGLHAAARPTTADAAASRTAPAPSRPAGPPILR